MTRLLPWTVLVLGVALLQSHAWYWWTHLITGAQPCFDRWACAAPWDGWGWAVSLEALALWSWPQRGWVRWGVGLACTLVLLTGVLWRVSDPAVRALFQPAVAMESAEAEALRGQIAVKRDSLAGYVASRATGSQRAAERELDGLYTTLRQRLGADRAEARARAASLDWRTWAGIALQGLGVIVLQVGVILAVVRLFGGGRVGRIPWQDYIRAASEPPIEEKIARIVAEVPPAEWRRRPHPWQPETAPETPFPARGDNHRRPRPPADMAGLDLATYVRAEVERRYPTLTLSQRTAQLGLNKKDLSLLFRYEQQDVMGTHGLDTYVAKVRDALWPADKGVA